MFVQKSLKLAACALMATLACLPALSASAADATVETVPLTVTLTNVQASDVPLYISVQTKADYRSMKGHGTILKSTQAGDITETINLPSGGDYAVSIWHDLDDDGRFSMNERYEILDGWGSSGKASAKTAPTFEDVKVDVPSFGTSTTIEMIYPN